MPNFTCLAPVGSLAVASKPKAKENIPVTAKLFFTSYKQITLTNAAHFSKIYSVTMHQDPKLSDASLAPPHKFQYPSFCYYSL
jgi:hypothetical protein